jgi:hypothetical protein
MGIREIWTVTGAVLIVVALVSHRSFINAASVRMTTVEPGTCPASRRLIEHTRWGDLDAESRVMPGFRYRALSEVPTSERQIVYQLVASMDDPIRKEKQFGHPNVAMEL